MNHFSKTVQAWMMIGISSASMITVVGCASTPDKDKTAAIRSDVTDVHPMEAAAPASYQPPLYDTSAVVPTAPQAVSADPVAAATPAKTPMMSTTPAASFGASSAGTSHVVRRGETFFSIAKASYGDGKQWKKLASANPSVSASHLKVGQVIVVP